VSDPVPTASPSTDAPAAPAAETVAPSRTFHFTRDGHRIVVAQEGRLEVFHIEGAEPSRQIPVTGVRDFAVFDDDVWVVTGDPPTLQRFTLAGRPVGDPFEIPSSEEGRLIACPFGSPSALWLGRPAVEVRDDLGRLSHGEVVGDYDFIVALGARRWLIARGAHLVLRQPGGEEALTPHTTFEQARVLDGAAVFEGRSVALLVDHVGQSEQNLIVLSPRGGILQHRLRLEGITGARFAPRRGYVLLRRGDREMILADLRFGKVLKHVAEPRRVLDLDLDGAAQHIALRLEDESGQIGTVYTTYRDFLSAASPDAPAAPPPEWEEAQEPEVVEAAPAARPEPRAARRAPGENGRSARPPANADREARMAAALAAAAAAAEAEYAGEAAPAPALPEPSPSAATEASPSPAPPAPREPEIELPAELPDLAALQPRSRRPLCPRDVSLALLDRYLDLVGAWAEKAIATGWDTGQIVFPADSGHPFEKEVAGILGHTAGHAPDHLRNAEMRVAEIQAQLRYVGLPAGTVSPLEALVQEFGLSPLATDILLVCAAPTIWGELARLYGILTNDPDRPLVDELLVHQVLGPARASRHDVASELDRDAPLMRWGLVRPGEGKTRPFIALHVDPIVVRRLRGDTFDEPEPDEPCVLRPADRRIQEIVAPRKLLAEMIVRLARPAHEGFARIVVRGRLGSGRRTVMSTFTAEANRRLGVIDVSLLPRDPRVLVEGIRTELMRTVLRGWLPCVSGIDEVTFEDPSYRDRMREMFRSHPGPIAFRVGPEATPPIDPGYLQFDLPPLGEVQRLECWRRALDERGLRVRDLEGLAARFRVGPGVVERVSARVSADLPSLSGDAADPTTRDVTDEIEEGVRQFLEVRLGTVASRVTRLATWSSVVLPPDVIDTVREFIGRIKHRRTVYERWGFERTMSTSRGLTALFQGGPGTGKTMVAGIIARELGLDLYRVDLSRIMSKWIGETEKNLAAVFDAAEDGQAIILFDEADSLFAKRTEIKSSVDRYANLEVNYLLQRLDTFDGIAILTTNFGGSIDAAFKRRLSLRLTFPFPDEEMREELWRVHLPPELPVKGEFRLGELARKYQLSGGYIRNATLRAAFLAAQEESPLMHEHLERAVKLEFKELGKLAETGVLE
jgi:hypothetical protein